MAGCGECPPPCLCKKARVPLSMCRGSSCFQGLEAKACSLQAGLAIVQNSSECNKARVSLSICRGSSCFYGSGGQNRVPCRQDSHLSSSMPQNALECNKDRGTVSRGLEAKTSSLQAGLKSVQFGA